VVPDFGTLLVDIRLVHQMWKLKRGNKEREREREREKEKRLDQTTKASRGSDLFGILFSNNALQSTGSLSVVSKLSLTSSEAYCFEGNLMRF